MTTMICKMNNHAEERNQLCIYLARIAKERYIKNKEKRERGEKTQVKLNIFTMQKQIKKMFEMYVDGKMSLKPIPNYFDRILLGKIVAEYKTLTKKPKIVEEKKLSEEKIYFIMLKAIDRVKK